MSALSSSKLAAVAVGLRPPASEAAAAAALVIVEAPSWFVTGTFASNVFGMKGLGDRTRGRRSVGRVFFAWKHEQKRPNAGGRSTERC